MTGPTLTVAPIYEVFDIRSGDTIGFTAARDAREAVRLISARVAVVDRRFVDADLVPVERLHTLPPL